MSIGAELAARYAQDYKEFQEFITRMFTAITLDWLAEGPTTEDLASARQFLNDKDSLARAAALRIIASKGTATDVNALMEIARSSFGDERILALEGVQRLTTNRLETARALLALEGREMHRAALSLVGGLSDQDALPLLEELLSHENADLRIAAVGQIRKRIDDEQLADLLRTYTDLGTYFYNVVAWLDRMIYAPAPISSYYKAELQRKLEALDQ